MLCQRMGDEDGEHVRCADDDGERDPDEPERRATVGRVDEAGDGIHPATEGEGVEDSNEVVRGGIVEVIIENAIKGGFFLFFFYYFRN
jgi:hypothetical protein